MTTENMDGSSDEMPLEPELPICDAHHHLWERPPRDYLLKELLQDLHSGHNVVSTVAVECRYAYRKLKKVLARNGASMADVVKQVTYVIDARHQQEAGECRRQAYGSAPLPAHTFLNVSQLAWPAMLVEIDVIAMVPLR